MARTHIYLDNAATSWPKPVAVYQAVDGYQRECGAPAGRGAYASAQEAGRIVARARTGVAGLIGADPDEVIFAFNGTDALNLAIHGTLRPGDHVVTTVCEHNSVLRPLRHQVETNQVTVTYVPCDAQGFVSPDDIKKALQPNTRLVVVIHASNVTGALQPVAAIAQIVREHEALFLVDAAQTLGHVPLAVNLLGADLLAAPGHKGLLGPLGTGVLYVRASVQSQVKSLRQGGTGSHSEQDRQPDSLPDKLEAGNHNLPGLAGLAAAAGFLGTETIELLAAHESRITKRMLAGLEQIAGIRMHGPGHGENRLGVVSISVDGYDPQDVAALLDSSFGVQCRAGLHCAGRIHPALGTDRTDGTVRFSVGFATTETEIDRLLDAMDQICRTGALS